ncbi:MAG: TetR/AcrR family transcriptional regulator [Parvibaculum sp.]
MKKDTRSMLISAAAELLDQGGPASVTLREVGKRAGVSHNAPYKHFESKDNLLAAIAARELEGLSKMMDVPGGGKVTIAAVRKVLYAYVDWARTYPARFHLTFGPLPGADAELKTTAGESRKLLVELVGAAQKAELLPGTNADRMASLLQALAHGAADLALNGHLSATGKGQAEPEDLIDDLLRYLRLSAKTS